MRRSVCTLLFSALLGATALVLSTSTARSDDRGERRGVVGRPAWRGGEVPRGGWDRGYRGGYYGGRYGGYGYGYPAYGYGTAYYPGYYNGYYNATPGVYAGVTPSGVGVGVGPVGVGVGSGGVGFGYGWW
jgi:hypothetical protein